MRIWRERVMQNGERSMIVRAEVDESPPIFVDHSDRRDWEEGIARLAERLTAEATADAAPESDVEQALKSEQRRAGDLLTIINWLLIASNGEIRVPPSVILKDPDSLAFDRWEDKETGEQVFRIHRKF